MTIVSFDFEVTQGLDREGLGVDVGALGTISYDLDLTGMFDPGFDGSGIPSFTSAVNSVSFSYNASDGSVFEDFIDLNSFLPFEVTGAVRVQTDELGFSARLPLTSAPFSSYTVIFSEDEMVLNEGEIRAAQSLDDLFSADLLSMFVSSESRVLFGNSFQGGRHFEGVVTSVSLDGVQIDPIDVSQVPLGGSVGYLAVALGAVAIFKKFARRA